jgi:hypothetical protein
MMVHIGREPARARAHFHDATHKLASLMLPAAAGAWLLGPSVLPLLFTHRYDAAVPLFALATVEIPLWILPVDALLRAGGDTRFLFGFNALRVGVTAAAVLGGMRLIGLPGAIAGSLVSEALARAVMLLRGRRFLGGGAADVIDAPTLGRIALAAALACAPALAVRQLAALLGVAALPMVLAATTVYGVAYVILRLALSAERARSRP